MSHPVESPYLVVPGAELRIERMPTEPPAHARDRDRARSQLTQCREQLARLQRVLYADNRWSVLLLFQGLDASGKDGTIRALLEGVNPAGCQVHSFGAPSREELEHDFLWRTTCRLPERGRIGVFNRSYYEEVLVVRVHPELLRAQRLPGGEADLDRLWRERYASIREHERHLASNGTLVLKFWLNISRKEQQKRFLERIDDPHKRWKFTTQDVLERDSWDAYMRAFEDALRATSAPSAPWYAIPADDKPFARATVADIVVRAMVGLDLRYPEPSSEQLAELARMRAALKL